ncbi:hypothetical protein ABZ896_27980 [Streptomyces sp. NPDC047072]|uniref:hypothetical protein n=1 Tax=Streptomyces sp. NPDC047072 TaxID=3154809 RepID=UPI0033C5B33A
MEPSEVLARLRSLLDVEHRPTIIVVSGGEPMMQQRELVPLTGCRCGPAMHLFEADPGGLGQPPLLGPRGHLCRDRCDATSDEFDNGSKRLGRVAAVLW